MSYFLGIDIGGTNVDFGVVNSSGEILFESTLQTSDFTTAEELAATINMAVKSNFKDKLSAIGIGAPSVNRETEEIEYAPNLNWGEIIPIKTIFEEQFELPVSVENDANAYAKGIQVFGEGKDLNNFAVVTLGTGVGLGSVINSAVVSGNNGLAGELGHMVVHREGRECNCGNLGCLEAYVGAEGIVTTAKEKLEFSSGGSALNAIQPSDLSPLEIFNAARKDDPVSLEVVDSVCHDLGFALSGLINLMDIENIFLTGGITHAGNILRRKTEKHLKNFVLPNLRNKVNLRITSLNQTGGGILGAVAIIKDFTPAAVS
ncbi:ROK family protein [Paracrocinitomix mangrovi]|uniref:ROK family protein n=1 Tax=Paracrocinitomix mangrovi TaxID=2862509 RepID=UPI001C8CF7FB|nr:ROK family protein [Paracrocinitomix mangrovi]UKN02075.1 ROK family protein [Paracrocinitomix mangrovi]